MWLFNIYWVWCLLQSLLQVAITISQYQIDSILQALMQRIDVFDISAQLMAPCISSNEPDWQHMVCGFSFGCDWYPPAAVIDSDSANLILDQFILHVLHFAQSNLSHGEIQSKESLMYPKRLRRKGLNDWRSLEVSRGEESVSGSTGTLERKAV